MKAGQGLADAALDDDSGGLGSSSGSLRPDRSPPGGLVDDDDGVSRF